MKKFTMKDLLFNLSKKLPYSSKYYGDVIYCYDDKLYNRLHQTNSFFIPSFYTQLKK